MENKISDYKTKFDKLIELESSNDFIMNQVHGEYYYPYIRTYMMYSWLANLSAGHGSSSFYIPRIQNVIKERQISSLNEEIDVLIVNFNRRVPFQNGDNIDIKTNDIFKKIKETDKVIQLTLEQELPYFGNDDSSYFMQDVFFDFTKNTFEKPITNADIPKEIKNEFAYNLKNWELNKINFFVTRVHDYLRNVFLKIKPKQIIITSNYMRIPFIIIAKEFDIPVYEIQYSAIHDYHHAYDFGSNEYYFYSDYLLVWGESFQKFPKFPKNLKGVITVGNNEMKPLVTTKNNKKVVVLSQNAISTKMVELAVEFKNANPSYDVVFKKHPNEHIVNEQLLLNNNISISANNVLDETKDAMYCLGAASTALFEASSNGCKIFILETPFKFFMDEYISNGTFTFLKDVRKFQELIEIENTQSSFLEPFHLNWNEIKETRESIPSITAKNIMQKDDVYLPQPNNSKKLLTVIVTTYNSKKNIIRNIRSITNMYYFENINVIFSDDFSKDGTIEILSDLALQYKNITLIKSDKNSGSAVEPRNKALNIVETKFVTFLDDDDELFYLGLDNALNKLKNNETDLLLAPYVRNFGGSYSLQGKMYSRDMVADTIQTPYVWGKIYKTSLIKENNIKFNHGIGEDLTFNIEYIKFSKTYQYSNTPIVLHNKTLGGMSGNFSARNLVDTLSLRVKDANNIKLIEPSRYEKFVEFWIFTCLFANTPFSAEALELNDEVTKLLDQLNIPILKKMQNKNTQEQLEILSYMYAPLKITFKPQDDCLAIVDTYNKSGIFRNKELINADKPLMLKYGINKVYSEDNKHNSIVYGPWFKKHFYNDNIYIIYTGKFSATVIKLKQNIPNRVLVKLIVRNKTSKILNKLFNR